MHDTPMTRRSALRLSAIGAGAALLGGRAGTAQSPPQAGVPAGRTIIGVCRSVETGPAARQGGVAYLEVSCRQWLVPDKPREAFEERLKAIRACEVPVLAANSFLPGSLQCVGPNADHDAVLKYADVAFARAREAGIRIVTFGSAGARQRPDGCSQADANLQFVAVLARMAPLAAKHDVLVCVEPLHKGETNMINRVSEAHRLVEAVQHPHVGITADFFHMARENEGPESIRAAGSLIKHVHVAEEAKRTPPGVDGDDFRAYIRALDAIDYRGLLSIESRWGDFDDEVAGAVTALRKQCAAVWGP